jgi:hypothetical protein
VLAHGSTQDFTGQADDEESGRAAGNLIDLASLAEHAFDYIALGDWHGAKQVGSKAWYSGTPELDRFPKGADHKQGCVLAVTATRGERPSVEIVSTARMGWHCLAYDFTDDHGLERLQGAASQLIGSIANSSLLHLDLTGSIGLQTAAELDAYLETLRARILRLKLTDRTIVAPSAAETRALAERETDPLIARVAARLVHRAAGSDEAAAVARVALRELHAACSRS